MRFEDLEFKEKGSSKIDMGKQAKIKFKNGYGLSIITGKGSYSSESKPYEVAIFYNDVISYNTEFTDDVLGWQDKKDVETLMNGVKNLK